MEQRHVHVRASVFQKELGRHRPDILSACRVALSQDEADGHFLHIPAEQFALCADESVDYAVMEHTAAGLVVPLDAGWNDLGSWAAIWDVGPHDANKNRLEGDVMAIDSYKCLVQSHHRLVATVGLQDLIVIETKDAVLVANKHDSQRHLSRCLSFWSIFPRLYQWVADDRSHQSARP